MVGHGQLDTTLVSESCKDISSESCPQADTISSCITQKSRWIIKSFPGKSNIRIK